MARVVFKIFPLPTGMPTTFQAIVSCPNGFSYCYNLSGGAVWKVETTNPLNAVNIGNLPSSGSFVYGLADYDPINNQILIAPIFAPFFARVNCANDEISTIGTNLGAAIKYFDVHFYNGKMYGFPRNTLERFEFDCLTQTFSFFNLGISGNFKWTNTINFDNNLYVGSCSRNFIGKLDTLTGVFSELPTNISANTGDSRVYIGILNGDLYLFRESIADSGVSGVYKMDLTTNIITQINPAGRGGNVPFKMFNRLYYNTTFSNAGAFLADLNPTLQSGIISLSIQPMSSLKNIPFNNRTIEVRATAGGIITLKFNEV